MSSSRLTLSTQAPTQAPSPLEPSYLDRPQPLPVNRPKLPTATQMAALLLDIDESRSYADGGPLSKRLLSELSSHLGCSQDSLVTAASGASGITAALLALALPEDSICLMPSWTSTATPRAAIAAGLKPFFLDVDRHTWALNPQAVRQTLKQTGCQARSLIVVSPFGASIDITAWEAFQHETGIAVIVDAAAGFDTVRASSLISVVSLASNKIFTAGEGGFVITPNTEMRDRVKACSNPGLTGSRIAHHRAINSKMSEYHAAIAIANLDNWPATRLKHLQIAGWYRHAISQLPRVVLQPGYGAGWVGGSTNILLESDSAESISRYMFRDGIETRLSFAAGCHVQPAFSGYSHSDLSKTQYLAARVLGLPHFTEMEKSDVSQVVGALSKALTSRARGHRRLQSSY